MLNTLFPNSQTINCKGRILNFSKPQIMGILNVTPDSFFKESRVNPDDSLVEKARRMLAQGASILDIGGHSTRPNAQPVSLEEELQRVVPVVEIIAKSMPEAIISVDTYRLEVAKQAIASGAHLVNDIGCGNMDEGMLAWVGKENIPYILSHSVGLLQEVHQLPNYLNVVEDVWKDLLNKVNYLREMGHTNLIIDPGLGFSKSLDHNYQLLAHLEQLLTIGVPVLIGLSRKTMICKVLDCKPEEALNGTTALHMAALMKGANILRVHDVKEAKEVVDLYLKLHANGLSDLS